MSAMWVYIQSEPTLWTVGFYAPDGKWHPDSDHSDREAATTRCAWLNGGKGETLAPLYEALQPFAHFAAQWAKNPIGGLDDVLYAIHIGPQGAELRLSDCQKARDALRAAGAWSGSGSRSWSRSGSF